MNYNIVMTNEIQWNVNYPCKLGSTAEGEGDTNNQTMNKKYTINMNLNVVYN